MKHLVLTRIASPALHSTPGIAISIASFALGTFAIVIVVAQNVIRAVLGVDSLSDAVSSDLEHALLEASTFAAIAAAGLALVFGVFAMVRFRRKSILAILGTCFGFALLAWVVAGLVRFIA